VSVDHSLRRQEWGEKRVRSMWWLRRGEGQGRSGGGEGERHGRASRVGWMRRLMCHAASRGEDDIQMMGAPRTREGARPRPCKHLP
jgi:hypothetical protein